MNYSIGNYKRFAPGDQYVNESHDVNEMFLTLLGASLALGGLAQCMMAFTGMYSAMNPFAAMMANAAKGGEKEKEKGGGSPTWEEIKKYMDNLKKEGKDINTATPEDLKKAGVPDDQISEIQKTQDQAKENETKIEDQKTKMENIAIFTRKQCANGSDEDKAFMDELSAALYDDNGNPRTPDQINESLQGGLQQKLDNYTKAHKEEMEKAGVNVDKLEEEANKMSPTDKAKYLSENKIGAVNHHAAMEAKKLDEEKAQKEAAAAEEYRQALAAATDDAAKKQVEDNYKQKKLDMQKEYDDKKKALDDKKKSSMDKCLKDCEENEKRALAQEKTEKLNQPGLTDEQKASIQSDFAQREKDLQKAHEDRRAAQAGGTPQTPPATTPTTQTTPEGEPKEGEPKEGEEENKTDDELKQELKDKYKDKSGDDVPESLRGEDGKFDPSKVDGLSGDGLKQAAQTAGIKTTKPKQQGEPKEGEPKEGEPKPKEDDKGTKSFKAKDGTEYSKDGDKYVMKTKDGDTTQISKEDFETEFKKVQRSYKTNDDKKFPYYSDEGDETGNYVVKTDDGKYEVQDDKGNKISDATEQDFNDAKTLYDDEKEDIEHEGDDKEEGDDVTDENGKKLENPAKIWHKRKNKRTNKVTTNYYNKNGDSINPKEFHDKLNRYRERKRAMTHESRRFTEKTLSEYLFEKLGK